jgi:TPR repeat protein
MQHADDVFFESQVSAQRAQRQIREGNIQQASFFHQKQFQSLRAAIQIDDHHCDALNSLGVAYAKGHGVVKDDKEAVRWY